MIIIALLLISCGKTSLKYGTRGVCNSISESKQRNVFINQYEFDLNFNKSKDSLNIQIDSIWLEHSWKYDYPFDKTIIGKGYHLVIKMESEECIQSYNQKWFLGTDYEFNFTPSGKKILVSNYLSELPFDFLFIKIQKEDFLAEHQAKYLIGNLKLKTL